MRAQPPMRRRRRPWVRGVVVVALVAGLAACVDSPPQAASPPPPASSSAPGPSGSGSAQGWAPCEAPLFGLLCALVPSPDPAGAPVRVGMQPARVPAARVGLLVYGVGGPGLAQRAALAQILDGLPARVQDRFDVAAVEPPGVGPDGEPGVLTCAAGDLGRWLEVDLQAADPKARTAVHAAAKRLVQACVNPQVDLARRMSTADAVAGVEALRVRAGGGPVTYVGTSYDSLTGHAYARRYPGAVRALLLDSGLDPALTGAALLRERAVAVEAALRRFTAACRADACLGSLSVPDAVQRLRATPPGGLTRRKLDEALLGGLTDERSGWSDLRNGLRMALDGNPDLLRQVADSYQARDAKGSPTSHPVQSAAYLCRDRAWPRSPKELDALADQVAAAAPVLGRAVVYGAALCTTWPVPPRPLPAAAAAGARPPVLVLAVDGDPVTPAAWSRRLAASFGPRAPLLTIPGGWHTVLPTARNACATRAAETFLTDPSTPSPTTCPKQ